MHLSKPRVARDVTLAVAFAVSAAGCDGGANSAFNTLPGSIVNAARGENPSAKSAAKLYVANAGGGVFAYSTASNHALLQTITDGVPSPGGIWVDDHQILYVVNASESSKQGSIAEYKPGASAPFRTITNGIVNCQYVAADKHENVYVACIDNASSSFTLEIYSKGQLNPAKTITIPTAKNSLSRLSGLAFDSTGALLVGESVYFQQGVVYRLAPGSQSFTNLNLRNATGGTIAVDKAGNLYVGSGSSAGDQVIGIYPPNSTSPSVEITAQNILYALAVEPSGELYVETGGGGPPQISVYPPGGVNPLQTFDVGAAGSGLALSR